jgi:glycosyltransferase involved in cell wall biosynthesis
LKKLRIVVAGTRGFPGVQGGVEVHCQNLYPELVRLGCEVIVLARRPYIAKDIRSYKDVKIIRVPAVRHKYLEAFLHTFLCILIAPLLKPDILHIHAIGPSFFIPLARFLGMKVVLTSHGPDYEHLKWNTFSRSFLKLCERIGARSADRIIGVSRDIAHNISMKYEKPSFAISNGVTRFSHYDGDSTRKMFGLKKRKYIISVGRLVPSKGFEILIRAFNRAQELSLPDVKLVIVGGSDHRDEYGRLIAELAHQNKNIILTGILTGDNLGELYRDANLFVLASYYEGFSLALLEAMSFGLSCIATDIPSNREAGLSRDRYFIPGDIEKLREKIIVFNNKLMSTHEREEQSRTVKEKYDWREIAKKTLTVYETILSL